MATLKIGLVPSTLNTMPHPNGQIGLGKEFIVQRDEMDTVFGDVKITYTGKEKQKLMASFTNKNKADFDTLKAYCNVPMEYWVEVENIHGTKYVEGWAELTCDKLDYETQTSDFRHGFTIQINLL